MPFPTDFAWGAATSSYQIEGAVEADGKGASIWDTFAHTPGAIANGDTGDVACDHYHRWRDDVELMASYGLNAYRFSVSWPRVQPDGRGRPNEQGLDFYRRLTEALRERGIRPALTLNHWDIPQALQDRGGWQSRDTVERFADYARLCAEALRDRVEWWITHNEPWIISALGYRLGIHAPGVKDTEAELRTAHHLLLSHGAAVEAYRATGLAAPVGITLNLLPTYPQTESEADARAATLSDGYTNRWYLEPVFNGRYPADMLEYFGDRFSLDWIRPGDVERAAQPIDFLGVNYYSRRVVRAPRPDEQAEFAWVVRTETTTGVPTSDLGWEMTPPVLRDLLVHLRDTYRSPTILITENGCSLNDEIAPDGRVHDPRRIAFLDGHLRAVAEAIDAGVDVRGYFAWSLLDNFEWAEGYGPRFGLSYVDYPTQRRIPKDSFAWYRDVVAGNGPA
ncbi:MAG: beta-glucosidase [Chloroflexi bacterium]|nr:beta-glucosidase [Chloroflexota bacterium]